MSNTTRRVYVVSDSPLSPAQIVSALTKAELDQVLAGSLRLGATRDEDVAIWNAAIDRDNGWG